LHKDNAQGFVPQVLSLVVCMESRTFIIMLQGGTTSIPTGRHR